MSRDDFMELIAAVDRSAIPYAHYLATHASPAGDVIDSRALAAEHFHVNTRTITRWRAALVRAGYLLPYGGGIRASAYGP